jgi:hypothetical protein
LSDLKPATDYFTPQEIEAFKKPKKVRKVLRKTKTLKADDLLPLAPSLSTEKSKVKQEEISDMGQESSDATTSVSFNKRAKISSTDQTSGTISLKDIEMDLEREKKRKNRKELDDDDSEGGESDENSEDDIDLNKLKNADDFKDILEEENNVLEELHSVLSKTRKRMIEPLSLMIKQEPELTSENQNNGVSFENLNTIVEKEEEEDNALTLDTMSEFCRNLGNLPTTSSNAHTTSN